MQQKEISELEKLVMDIVWQRGSCSARDIQQDLQITRTIAYTTVTTLLKRLVVKDMVSRKANGIIYLYQPKQTKETYSKKIAHSFITKFFSSYGDIAISSFAESIDDLPKEKQDYLLQLLKKHEKHT